MTEETRLDILDRKVTKANELIQRTRHTLSLQQQKIVLYLISQITPYDDDFKEYEFSVPEFCQICGINYKSGKNYKDIKDAILGIKNKSFWMSDPQDPKHHYTMSWIGRATIYENRGVVKLSLDPCMKPYLLNLKDNFTSYELIWSLHFKSKYTVRLYEIIKSIHFNEIDTYERTYELNELRKMLDAETYDRWIHFRSRVLQPSVDEINAYSDKNIKYETIKAGKAVSRIKFTISTKDSMEMLRIRDIVEHDMGFEQMSLWETITTNE